MLGVTFAAELKNLFEHETGGGPFWKSQSSGPDGRECYGSQFFLLWLRQAAPHNVPENLQLNSYQKPTLAKMWLARISHGNNNKPRLQYIYIFLAAYQSLDLVATLVFIFLNLSTFSASSRKYLLQCPCNFLYMELKSQTLLSALPDILCILHNTKPGKGEEKRGRSSVFLEWQHSSLINLVQWVSVVTLGQ